MVNRLPEGDLGRMIYSVSFSVVPAPACCITSTFQSQKLIPSLWVVKRRIGRGGKKK